MLTLNALWIYPVKSLAGIAMTEAVVEDRGLENDRRFMVVDENGRFLSQREIPAMALIKTAIDRHELTLNRAGMSALHVRLDAIGPEREVVIWDDRCAAIDVGEDAAIWLGEVLGRPARLVRMPARTRRAVDPRFANDSEIVSFADGFAFLLTTDASLASLNEHLARPIDARRFRPNLIVAGVAEPFVEDRWAQIDIGSVRFILCKPCARCAIVDVDPDTGERGTDVLATLAELRRHGSRVLFGQNLSHRGTGVLRVGDQVRVELTR